MMDKNNGKKPRSIFYIILTLIMISSIIVNINVYHINKQRNGYYIGKIESMNEKDGITTMEVSPISSKCKFAYEIKANHRIEYKTDHINISGLSDQGSKNSKSVRLGELGEIIKNLKVGDTVIFKTKDSGYDKGMYNLKVSELAVDLTLE